MSVDGAGEALCTWSLIDSPPIEGTTPHIVDSKINGADASTILFLAVFQGSWQDIDMSGKDASPWLQVHHIENCCQKDVRITRTIQSMCNFYTAYTRRLRVAAYQIWDADSIKEVYSRIINLGRVIIVWYKQHCTQNRPSIYHARFQA